VVDGERVEATGRDEHAITDLFVGAVTGAKHPHGQPVGIREFHGLDHVFGRGRANGDLG
jgi:hypothetical protein